MTLGQPKPFIVGAALLLGAASLGGCATKSFVREQVGVVDTKLQTTQQDVATQQGVNTQQETKIAELDRTSREALERATAAGKLAEGKFLFETVLSDDATKFPTNESALSPEAEQRLMELAAKLKTDNKNVYLEIQGHTDATGTPTYNEHLGQMRAEAVRLFLNKQGVPLNRMASISYGDQAPVADNHTREGRAQNRRVVVVVLA